VGLHPLGRQLAGGNAVALGGELVETVAGPAHEPSQHRIIGLRINAVVG